MTGTAERAGVAWTAAGGTAADGGTALADCSSAAAAAVPPPLTPVRRTSAVSSALQGRSTSSRPALCCFIATVPWSGSRLLSEALYNTGVAGHPHEYFAPDFRGAWAHRWDLSPEASIAEYISAAKARTRTPNGVFSVKVHWDQLRWLYSELASGAFFTRAHAAELVEARLAPLQYVFLWRSDSARQAISYYRGEFDSDPVDLQQIRWFEDVVVEHREKWRQYFATGGIEPIEVQYESLVTSYEETVARLLSQLGLQSGGSVSLERGRTLRREADDRTEAILAAYLPVRDHLAPKGPEVRWDASSKRFVIGDRRPAWPTRNF